MTANSPDSDLNLAPKNSHAPSIKRDQEVKYRGVYEKVPGSGIWWIRYYDADGQKHREKVGRKSAAIKLYQVRKAAILEGTKMPANLRNSGEKLSTLLNTALEWYQSHRPKSVKHVTTHIKAITEEFGDRIAASLKPDEVDKWLAGHTEWSPATMNRHKATLSKALQLAVIDGKLERNIARLVSVRKENNERVRWLKDDEEKRIVEAIKDQCPEHLPAFVVALHTGMRQSEQFGLKWDTVDMKRRRIYLGKTKNGKDREIPMSKTCHRMFCDLWQERKQRVKDTETASDWVFPSSRFAQKRVYNPRFWFEPALEAAKVKDFHWHDLRHTFCTRLVMKGVSLRAVMELAGHSSIHVTTRYAHVAPEHNKAAIEMLD